VVFSVYLNNDINYLNKSSSFGEFIKSEIPPIDKVSMNFSISSTD